MQPAPFKFSLQSHVCEIFAGPLGIVRPIAAVLVAAIARRSNSSAAHQGVWNKNFPAFTDGVPVRRRRGARHAAVISRTARNGCGAGRIPSGSASATSSFARQGCPRIDANQPCCSSPAVLARILVAAAIVAVGIRRRGLISIDL